MTTSGTTLTVDVVVVGAGLSGVTAALTAAESGVSVALLEKGPTTGGSSDRSGGGLVFAGTDVQRAHGVDDGPELLRTAILDYGKHKSDPATVDVYVRHQLETFTWLQQRGVEFGLVDTGTSETSRIHTTPPGWLTGFLHQQFVARDNIEYRSDARAHRLVTDGGRVTGVLVDLAGEQARVEGRRGVVLASGGFARSPELLETFAPRWADAVKMSGRHNTGDGLRMAWELGAAVADMGYISPSFGASIANYPDLTPDPDDDPILLFPIMQGAVIVNLEAARFVNESLNYKTISSIVTDQPQGIGFQLFDDKIMARSRTGPGPGGWRDGFERGYVLSGDTLAELATAMRVEATALQETVDRYNDFADEGHDADFGRTVHDYGTAGGGRIDTGPFYAYPCKNGLTTTYCGLRVDGRLRVLDVYGEPIAGLFAAGEVVGGFHGAAYLSGTALGKAAVFGRAAGLEVGAG
jgi:fumarate reductase flavoprotein subunit